MKNTIKTQIQEITGFRISVRDNGEVLTVSNKDGDKGSFGSFKDEICNKFNVVRFDGGSFDVAKETK